MHEFSDGRVLGFYPDLGFFLAGAAVVAVAVGLLFVTAGAEMLWRRLASRLDREMQFATDMCLEFQGNGNG